MSVGADPCDSLLTWAAEARHWLGAGQPSKAASAALLAGAAAAALMRRGGPAYPCPFDQAGEERLAEAYAEGSGMRPRDGQPLGSWRPQPGSTQAAHAQGRDE